MIFYFFKVYSFTLSDTKVMVLQHNIFFASCRFNLRFLIFYQKIFTKSFFSRLRSVRDINELDIGNVQFITEELIRITLLLRTFSNFSFNSEKKSTFNIYNLSFIKLLSLSYLPYFEPFLDKFNLTSRIFFNSPSISYQKLSSYLMHNNITSNFSFKIFFSFKTRTICWFSKYFPFNKSFLRKYLLCFALNENIDFYAQELNSFNYSIFNLFLFTYLTNDLLRVCYIRLLFH